MADGSNGYPVVFSVDDSTARPPLHPRRSRQRRDVRSTQTLMSLLLCLALCGMSIEACFIYRLYYPDPVDSTFAFKSSKAKEDPPTTESPSSVIQPSKPIAHLTDGQTPDPPDQIMSWNADRNHLQHKMTYRERKLFIETEGYYYIYSKVSFRNEFPFWHSVNMDSPRYPGGHITLLQSMWFNPGSSREAHFNSFLGGAFHLNPNDAIFVSVFNTSQILRAGNYANYFGAYMM